MKLRIRRDAVTGVAIARLQGPADEFQPKASPMSVDIQIHPDKKNEVAKLVFVNKGVVSDEGVELVLNVGEWSDWVPVELPLLPFQHLSGECRFYLKALDPYFELYVSPASITEKVIFFTCSYSPAQRVSNGGGIKEEGEDIEVVETTLVNAANMVASGEIVDAKTVVLIQYLSDRLRSPKSL
jgi:hypothetical protein